MEGQPLDLNLQKRINKTQTLIVFAIIFSLYNIVVVPILTYTIRLNTYYPIYETVIFWLNISFAIFDFIILYIILNKKLRRPQKLAFYLLAYKLVSLCIAIIFLFRYLSLVNFFSFISQAIVVTLLWFFYLKIRNKQTYPNLAKALLIIFAIIFIIDMCRQFVFGQNSTSVALNLGESLAFHSASLANYFVIFVFSWIACMSIENEGFYKYFIEALPKKAIEV